MRWSQWFQCYTCAFSCESERRARCAGRNGLSADHARFRARVSGGPVVLVEMAPVLPMCVYPRELGKARCAGRNGSSATHARLHARVRSRHVNWSEWSQCCLCVLSCESERRACCVGRNGSSTTHACFRARVSGGFVVMACAPSRGMRLSRQGWRCAAAGR